MFLMTIYYITICISWKLNVDVDIGALHFCGIIGANLAVPFLGHFSTTRFGYDCATEMLCTKIHVYIKFPVDTDDI